MFLSDLSIRRPVMTSMIVLAVVVLGLFSVTRLGIDIFPNIDFPFVTVSILYPGAGPEEIETLILKPVEDEVGTLSGIRTIQSYAQEGIGYVFLEFNLGTNVDLAAMDVRDKVDAVRNELPVDAKAPVVQKFDVGARPIVNLAVTSTRPLEQTYKLADDVIRQRLSRVDGLANISLVGGKQREIRVSIFRNRLRDLDISVFQVIQAIATANLNLPSGRIEEGRKDYTIRLAGEFGSLDDLRELQIPAHDGKPVRLRDVANIEDTFAEVREMARFEGKTSIGLSCVKKSGANTVQVAAGIMKELSALKQVLPADVQIYVAKNSSTFIKDSIQEVASNMMLGIMLTAIVLFLFLHSWRGTVIAAVSMPASIIASFLLVDIAGFTINMMTLMGLAISIGILVTNSIVVLENITRFEAQGQNLRDAASKGTSEIAIAVIASTLTNVMVFTPIAFMSGITGRIFREFGLTVTFATLFSLLISFTVVPILASRKMKWQMYVILGILGGIGAFILLGHLVAILGLLGLILALVMQTTGIMSKLFILWDRVYDDLAKSYRSTLDWCLGHRFVVILTVLIIFLASMTLFRYIGVEFFPTTDAGAFSVSIEMPPGTRLEVTDQVVHQIEDVVQTIPEVTSYYSTIGSSESGTFGTTEGVQLGYIYINLEDIRQRKRSTEQIIEAVRSRIAEIPAADLTLAPESQMGGGGGGGDLQLEITGDDMAQLVKLSNQVMAIARETRGTVDVTRSWKTGKPEVAVEPLRDRIAAQSTSAQEVALTLRYLLEGDVASKYREGADEYDIRVQASSEDRSQISQLENYEIKTSNGWIPLPELASIQQRSGPTQIIRKNKQREVIVSANLVGISLGQAQKEIQAASENIIWPEGYRLNFGGQAEWMAQEFPYMFQALILAIILTFMLLAAILESVIHPFTIMMTLPLALIGVTASLVITGNTISILTLMAFVMLVGIVVNNGILLIDYISRLRADGRPMKEAVLEACPVRLRPIIMTNVATILGMVPLALGFGTGAGFRAPMAIVSIGGLITSTIFTLYLIPVIYHVFESMRTEGGFFRWTWHTWKRL
jgi:HAE1 family hydrophobic/amphiphilic exporter-1